MEAAARIAAGVVLLVAALAKARLGRELPDVLAPYGVPGRARPALAASLVLVEAVIGALLIGGVAGAKATYAALALALVFVGAALVARLRGLRRIRCGCFGTRERAWGLVLLRALAFAALTGTAAFGGELGLGPASPDTLVLVALGALAAAVAILALLVLALYRQVGVLTLRISPRAALELAEEGPPLAGTAPPLGGLARRGVVLVAFLSEECRLCRELAPAVRALERDGVRTRVAYEAAEPDAFRRWNVPGSPFVVYVVDGIVAAKGLVDSLEQLDGLLAVATARRRDAAA